MLKNTKNLFACILLAILSIVGCKKTDYNFGDIKAPTGLTVTTAITGVNTSNPDGNGTGTVVINATAANALTYNIDFGDGKTQVVPSGSLTYKYNTPGTNEFTIVVNAIGTGGAVSTVSKKIKIFVAFEIPANIVAALTGGSSKTWVVDKNANEHFGVGGATNFTPNFYAAAPNARTPCEYDDDITFSKDVSNNITLAIDNKGQSFSIGAATAFYGFTGGDGCYTLAVTPRKLVFMDANTGSTASNSTRIAFTVPGNGIIAFGTGGTSYEILSISATEFHLRNIGIDGNSWYQKFKAK